MLRPLQCMGAHADGIRGLIILGDSCGHDLAEGAPPSLLGRWLTEGGDRSLGWRAAARIESRRYWMRGRYRGISTFSAYRGRFGREAVREALRPCEVRRQYIRSLSGKAYAFHEESRSDATIVPSIANRPN
jgi:hypothetical protein